MLVNKDKLPLRISFFGQGCIVHVGKFDEITWNRLNAEAAKLNMPLTDAIYDPSFYKNLKDIQISTLYDLGNYINIHGFINSNHSVIEFQQYRKRKRVINYNEIISSETLFPLFNIDLKQYPIDQKPRTLIAIEQEIGLIYKFKLNVLKFSFEKVRFKVSKLKNFNPELEIEMISEIYYNNVKLESFESNSLINRQYAVIADKDKN